MIVDYKNLYVTAIIKPAKLSEVKKTADKILEGKARYEAVAAKLGNGIPWWFISITHFMEAGLFYPKHFNFHLHCGDPLTGRTFHVPKNRPVSNPGGGKNPPSKENPYSWEESALDALVFMGYDKQTSWSISSCLFLFEKYNGMGYNKKGLLSPYVWSYTNHYVKGKYSDDGKYDPELISKQAGTAALMKQLNII
jgi:lysozyme family protein